MTNDSQTMLITIVFTFEVDIADCIFRYPRLLKWIH